MRHYPRTTLTASLMMLAIAGAAIAGSRDDACAACKSRDVRLCRRLAEQDNTDAQRMLSGIYVFGWGVKKDSTEALKWERLAAEHDPFSQQLLGSAYELGQTTTVWGRILLRPPNGTPRC
jgi:TPR repeat protein